MLNIDVIVPWPCRWYCNWNCKITQVVLFNAEQNTTITNNSKCLVRKFEVFIDIATCETCLTPTQYKTKPEHTKGLTADFKNSVFKWSHVGKNNMKYFICSTSEWSYGREGFEGCLYSKVARIIILTRSLIKMHVYACILLFHNCWNWSCNNWTNVSQGWHDGWCVLQQNLKKVSLHWHVTGEIY